jgi:hypothetical protein
MVAGVVKSTPNLGMLPVNAFEISEGGGASTEVQRDMLARMVFVRLGSAGLLAKPDARFDDPAPTGKTYGAIIRALVQDVDSNGKPDFVVCYDSLDALVTNQVVRQDTTARAILHALEGSAPPADLFLKFAPAPPLAAASKASLEAAMNAPKATARLQATFALSAAQRAGKADVQQEDAENCVLRMPPKLRLANGKVVPYKGERPANAMVLSGTEVHVKGGSASVILSDAQGRQFAFSVSPTGRVTSSDPSTQIPPRVVLQALEETLAAVTLKDVVAAPTLESFIKLREEQKRFRARTTPPRDHAEAVAWRAARASPGMVKKLHDEIYAELGVEPFSWFRYLGDVRAFELVRSIENAAIPDKGVSPELLFIVAMGEGGNDYVRQGGLTIDLNKPLSGFETLGTDTFGSAVGRLKQKGLLRRNVSYTIETKRNEQGQEVKSARFASFADGLTATASMLAEAREMFLRDVGPERSAQLTDDEINLFTYIYFNAGPERGKKRLDDPGLPAHMHWSGPHPGNNRDAAWNALERLGSLKMLQKLGIFSK